MFCSGCRVFMCSVCVFDKITTIFDVRCVYLKSKQTKISSSLQGNKQHLCINMDVCFTNFPKKKQICTECTHNARIYTHTHRFDYR